MCFAIEIFHGKPMLCVRQKTAATATRRKEIAMTEFFSFPDTESAAAFIDDMRSRWDWDYATATDGDRTVVAVCMDEV